MAADMKAVTAQSQKLELGTQVKLYDGAIALWSQAVAQCEGRAKERAQRNMGDDQKTSASLSEQLGSGPECAAAHKDAGALQEMARLTLGDRRYAEASVLYRKAENMWDLASERCTGSQQEIANRRRDQTEMDGQNAENCAPLFERAREHTQKLRSAGASLSREDKQEASLIAETLWREALGQCKGSAAQDIARNNAQTLARERGTPWVARAAPAPQPPLAKKSGAPTTTAELNQTSGKGTGIASGTMTALTSAFSAIGSAVTPATTTAATGAAGTAAITETGATVATALAAATSKVNFTEAQPAEFTAGTTRFTGKFVRDADGTTYSGTGKMTWTNGDVFEGTLIKSQRHGKGEIIWANGQSYSGDWVNDKPMGQARMRFANGNQYEGAVIDGQPQGKGRMVYASGDTYTGQFNAGGPEGKGLYAWKNGQQYDGDWKKGSPNGKGKLKFATGNQYEGAVVNGVPDGEGHMVFASGDTYTGHSTNGQPDGMGTFAWTSGDKYAGQWKAGKKHGQGTFTWKSGDLWEGIFENDEQLTRGAPAPAK